MYSRDKKCPKCGNNLWRDDYNFGDFPVCVMCQFEDRDKKQEDKHKNRVYKPLFLKNEDKDTSKSDGYYFTDIIDNNNFKIWEFYKKKRLVFKTSDIFIAYQVEKDFNFNMKIRLVDSEEKEIMYKRNTFLVIYEKGSIFKISNWREIDIEKELSGLKNYYGKMQKGIEYKNKFHQIESISDTVYYVRDKDNVLDVDSDIHRIYKDYNIPLKSTYHSRVVLERKKRDSDYLSTHKGYLLPDEIKNLLRSV